MIDLIMKDQQIIQLAEQCCIAHILSRVIDKLLNTLIREHISKVAKIGISTLDNIDIDAEKLTVILDTILHNEYIYSTHGIIIKQVFHDEYDVLLGFNCRLYSANSYESASNLAKKIDFLYTSLKNSIERDKRIEMLKKIKDEILSYQSDISDKLAKRLEEIIVEVLSNERSLSR